MSKLKKDHQSAGEVGYGRPPAANQFKPGQSGNPSGRKKKKERLPANPIDDALRERLSVSEKGKRQSLPAIAVIARQLIAAAARGNVQAAKLVLPHFVPEKELPPDFSLLTDEELNIVERILRKAEGIELSPEEQKDQEEKLAELRRRDEPPSD